MNFKDLDVWQKARALNKSVFENIQQIDFKGNYALLNQIQRSSISIASNIAEGSGRQYKKDTLQFLFIARGSLYELETQLIMLSDIGLLSKNNLSDLQLQTGTCLKLLSGLIRYLKNNVDLK